MPSYNHLILEVFCSYGWKENDSKQEHICCSNGIGNAGYHCFENKCKFVAYTCAPNEIAYSNENGEVPDYKACIGFGGDMEPIDTNEEEHESFVKLWESICRKKIKEAYVEYMDECIKKKPLNDKA